MKKITVIMITALAFPFLSRAYDTCCNTGNQYIGVLPAFNKHVFGLQYRYNSLHSQLSAGGSGNYATALEKYSTVEFWSGWNITGKIGILGVVPYRFETLNHQGATVSKKGLGDMYVLGYYKLFSNRHRVQSGKLLVQDLWFGAGIELPTGKYNAPDKSTLNDTVNLYQLGSGSTDVPFNIIYNICLAKAGLNVSLMYKINTVNQDDYEYGNRFNINAQGYYTFNIKPAVTVVPVISLQFENFQRSMDHGDWVEASAGNLITGTVGIQASFKTITIGGNFQTPLQQNVGKGMVEFNNTFMAHISFAL